MMFQVMSTNGNSKFVRGDLAVAIAIPCWTPRRKAGGSGVFVVRQSVIVF